MLFNFVLALCYWFNSFVLPLSVDLIISESSKKKKSNSQVPPKKRSTKDNFNEILNMLGIFFCFHCSRGHQPPWRLLSNADN